MLLFQSIKNIYSAFTGFFHFKYFYRPHHKQAVLLHLSTS